MLISERHAFIFIHIYKTAGTSVTEALRPFCKENRWIPAISVLFNKRDSPRLPCHATAADVIAANGRKWWDRFFTFAFVRNPWDREVSIYNYVLQQESHDWHERIKGFGSFDRYIRWACAHDDVHSQGGFIYSNSGELLVDFVGRYETIESDFQAVCNQIGVKAELPKLNVSNNNNRPYRECYTSVTRDLVGKALSSDIKLFGYGF